MHDTTHTQRSKGGLLPPCTPRSATKDGKRQIDTGDYTISAVGGGQVGEVYVEAAAAHADDPAHTVEHWCLYPAYQAPSPQHTDVAIELRYRGQFKTLNAFLENVAKIQGARYIRAVCDQLPVADALRATAASQATTPA